MLQAREGREGQQKIAALERSLQQVLADFDAERQMLLQQSGQQLAQAEAEANSLRRLAKSVFHHLLLACHDWHACASRAHPDSLRPIRGAGLLGTRCVGAYRMSIIFRPEDGFCLQGLLQCLQVS